jgi:hypothetical protein
VNIRHSGAAVALAAVLAAGGLASCGSSTKSSTATTTSSAAPSEGASSPAATGSPTTAAASSSTAKTADVCTLISATTAAQLSGQPYTTATQQSGDNQARCAYNNDDSTAEGVNLTIFSQGVDTTWQAVHIGSFTDVSGIGDKAFWDNDNTLYAQSGSMLIQVNGLESQANSEALAKALLNALP